MSTTQLSRERSLLNSLVAKHKKNTKLQATTVNQDSWKTTSLSSDISLSGKTVMAERDFSSFFHRSESRPWVPFIILKIARSLSRQFKNDIDVLWRRQERQYMVHRSENKGRRGGLTCMCPAQR